MILSILICHCHLLTMWIMCEQVEELISSNQLNIASEEKVFLAVLSWVKHDITERVQNIAKVSYIYTRLLTDYSTYVIFRDPSTACCGIIYSMHKTIWALILQLIIRYYFIHTVLHYKEENKPIHNATAATHCWLYFRYHISCTNFTFKNAKNNFKNLF